MDFYIDGKWSTSENQIEVSFVGEDIDAQVDEVWNQLAYGAVIVVKNLDSVGLDEVDCACNPWPP